MRTLPICLAGLMLASSPVGACIASKDDAADMVEIKFTVIDQALPSARVSGEIRADLVMRRAKAGRLWRDGTAMRRQGGDKDKDLASRGIIKQFAASEIAESIIKDLSLPIPIAPVSRGGLPCRAVFLPSTERAPTVEHR